MAVKTYKIAKPCNNMSFTLTGKSGNKQRYVFEGGSVINNKPARLILKTQYSQDLLEQSDVFKNGDVILERTDNGGETAVAGGSTALDGGRELKPVGNVKNATDAMEYVANEFGETAHNAQEAKTIAEKNGVTFPNLKVGRKG